MVKLKYKKVYEKYISEHTKPFTAYTDNLQCQLMLNAYRYFTPMGRWTSDLHLINSVHPHDVEEGHCTYVDHMRRQSTAR